MRDRLLDRSAHEIKLSRPPTPRQRVLEAPIRAPRAAHGHGLSPFLARPLPRPPLTSAPEREIAGLLATAGELCFRLGQVGRGQAHLRAARWIDRTAYDLRALAREGNLPVLHWLDPESRAQAEPIDFHALYYSVEGERETRLFLMNPTPDTIDVEVVAVGEDAIGELPLGSWTLEPLRHTDLSLREMLSGFEDRFATGRLRLSDRRASRPSGSGVEDPRG